MTLDLILFEILYYFLFNFKLDVLFVYNFKEKMFEISLFYFSDVEKVIKRHGLLFQRATYVALINTVMTPLDLDQEGERYENHRSKSISQLIAQDFHHTFREVIPK